MIVILAMPPNEDTRGGNDIQRLGGMRRSHISLCESARQRRGEHEEGEGEEGRAWHKIFWDEGKGGRKEGRGAHSLLRSTCFAALERMTARIRGSENSE